MNITPITTTQGEFLSVNLPEGATGFCIESGCLFTGPSSNDDWDIHGRIQLPPGTWEIMNCASLLTEEQCQTIAPYPAIRPKYGNPWEYTPASECLARSLNANGIHLVNPLGKQPEFVFDYYGKSPIEFARFEADMFKWQEAQSKVYDPLILRKI